MANHDQNFFRDVVDAVVGVASFNVTESCALEGFGGAW